MLCRALGDHGAPPCAASCWNRIMALVPPRRVSAFILGASFLCCLALADVRILSSNFTTYPVYPNRPPDYFSYPAYPNGGATYAAGDNVGAVLIAPPGWQLSVYITYVSTALGSAFCFVVHNSLLHTAISGLYGNTSSYGPYTGGSFSVALFASAGGDVSTGCTFSAQLTQCPAGSYCLNMTDPITCPVAYRCPLGSSAPIACGGGFYQNRTGQSTCVQCPVGSYCYVYYPYYTPIINPTICPVGSYCPAGTNQPIACPNGFYGATTGLQTSNCTGPCPRGTYCPGYRCGNGPSCYCGGCSSGTVLPWGCPPGAFCPAQSTWFTSCPSGYFGATANLTNSSCTSICPAGYYCPSFAAQYESSYWSNYGGFIGSTAPIACAAGTYCPIGSSGPTMCPMGSYCPALSAWYTFCPAGKFGSSPGLTTSACSGTCSAAYYCPLNSTSAYQIPCPLGSFCVAGVGAPTPCAAGRYGSTALLSSSDCSGQCLPGYYCPLGSVAPIQCPRGTYCPLVESNYTLCPEGTFGATPGLSSAACSGTCPPDYYCPPGSTGIGTATQTGSSTPSRTPSVTQSSSITASTSATPSQSPSLAGTPTQTGSPSESISASGTASFSSTSSASATPSLSPSPTRTPTQSATLTPTQSQQATGTTSVSPSLTSTPTTTLTPTPSQTHTGFLDQPIIDNTNLQRNPVMSSPSEASSCMQRFGVAIYWPEDDPVCGPGSYNLSGIVLALGMSAQSGLKPPLVFELWTADVNAGTVQPLVKLASYTERGKFVQNDADYLRVTLPTSTFFVDTLASRTHFISWYYNDTASPGLGVSWYYAQNGQQGLVNGGLPARGLAQPAASAKSVDGGVTWAESQLYGGILVTGAKFRCSPSPTPTASSSQSASGSQPFTPSATSSPSASGSRSSTGSGSATASAAATPSSTQSTSGTSSSTQSSPPTPSTSQTPSSSATASPSSSRSNSGTSSSTGSRTQVATLSQSASATVTPSSSATFSRTHTATPSRTATSSGSSTQSPSGSPSPTVTPYRSQTSTQTPSAARTPSSTGTPSLSQSLSSTDTPSQSTTPSPSSTASSSRTATPSDSGTRSQSLTSSASRSASLTSSASLTMTPSASGSRSTTGSLSPASTPSPTSSPSSKRTVSTTRTRTRTRSFSQTPTATLLSESSTGTPSSSTSESGTPSARSTGSSTPSAAASASGTQSRTMTGSRTASVTLSPVSPSQVPSLANCTLGDMAANCSAAVGGVAGAFDGIGQPTTAVVAGATIGGLLLLLLLLSLIFLLCCVVRKLKERKSPRTETGELHDSRNSQKQQQQQPLATSGTGSWTLNPAVANLPQVAAPALLASLEEGRAIGVVSELRMSPAPSSTTASAVGGRGAPTVEQPVLPAEVLSGQSVPGSRRAAHGCVTDTPETRTLSVQVGSSPRATMSTANPGIVSARKDAATSGIVSVHVDVAERPARADDSVGLGAPALPPGTAALSLPTSATAATPAIANPAATLTATAPIATATPAKGYVVSMSNTRRAATIAAVRKGAAGLRAQASQNAGQLRVRPSARRPASDNAGEMASTATSPMSQPSSAISVIAVVSPRDSADTARTGSRSVPSIEPASSASPAAPLDAASPRSPLPAPILDAEAVRQGSTSAVANATSLDDKQSAEGDPPSSAPASPVPDGDACFIGLAGDDVVETTVEAYAVVGSKSTRPHPLPDAPQSALVWRPSGTTAAATERNMPGWAARVRRLRARLREEKPSPMSAGSGTAAPSLRYISPPSNAAAAEAAAAALLSYSLESPDERGRQPQSMRLRDADGPAICADSSGGHGGRRAGINGSDIGATLGDSSRIAIVSSLHHTGSSPQGSRETTLRRVDTASPILVRKRQAASPLRALTARPGATTSAARPSEAAHVVELPDALPRKPLASDGAAATHNAAVVRPTRSLLARSGSAVSVRGRGIAALPLSPEGRQRPGGEGSPTSIPGQVTPLRSRSPGMRRLPHTASSPPTPSLRSQFVIVRSGLLLRPPEPGAQQLTSPANGGSPTE